METAEATTDAAESERVFEFRLKGVFFSIREIVRERKISPARWNRGPR